MEIVACRLCDAPTAAQVSQVNALSLELESKFGVSLRYESRKNWYGYGWYFVVSRSGAKRPRIGRPAKVLPPPNEIRQRHKEGRSMAALAQEYGVTRATLYKHLASDKH